MGRIHSHYLIGVDGGGTACRAVICDLQDVWLAEVIGGAANFTTDPVGTIENVRAVIDEAAAKASLSPDDIASSVVHVGLAGVMSACDSDKVVAALPFRNVVVSDDRQTFIAGALGDRDGVLAAIGTGTIVAARSKDSVRFFGGWGFQLADQASGAWLGKKALGRVLLAHDGLVAPSGLTISLAERFGDDPGGIIAFARTAQPKDYAAFAPAVIDSAQNGDPNGLALMHQAADYLNACMAAAGLEGDYSICLAGGVGPHYEAYLEQKYRDRIRPPLGTALDGALRLARQEFERLETTP